MFPDKGYRLVGVHVFLVFLCLGSVADGNIVDTIVNALSTLTLPFYTGTSLHRRFLENPDQQPHRWSSWGPWKCNYNHSTCLMGRFRSCSTGVDDHCNGDAYDVQHCNGAVCKQPFWLEWGDWQCSYFQNGCMMGRIRNCSTGKGSECTGNSNMVQPCDVTHCPQATISSTVRTSTVPPPSTTQAGQWGKWGSVICTYKGDGCVQARERNCSTGHSGDCPGSWYAITHCGTECQTRHWGHWGSWACTHSGNTCAQVRYRNCTTKQNGDCPGHPYEITVCGTVCQTTTPRVTTSTTPLKTTTGAPTTTTERVTTVAPSSTTPAGHWSKWGSWACTHSGNTCAQVRYRHCTTNQTGDCPGNPYEITVCGAECQTTTHRVTTSTTSLKTTTEAPTTTTERVTTVAPSSTTPAVWSSWFYGSCSATCGTGSQQGIRRCSSGIDIDCLGSSTTTKSCQEKLCGVWSPWFYGACSVTCGIGVKQGIRRCSSGNEHDCLGGGVQKSTCEDRKCPVDGEWGSWLMWGSCSESCGDGVRKRQRVCDNPSPQYNGQPCPGVGQEPGHCHTVDCPHWGSYHNTGPCSVTCGQGVITQQRQCSTGNDHDCTGSPYDEKPCSLPKC